MKNTLELESATIGIGHVLYGSKEALEELAKMERQIESLQRLLRRTRDLQEEIIKEYRAIKI